MIDRARFSGAPGGPRMSNETIYANWRPKPIMPHSVVAQTVFLNPREYEERNNRNPESVDYPITGKHDVAVLKGELCFEIPPPVIRRNNPNQSDVYVFTSANALRAADCLRMRFVGQVMKGTDDEDDKDKSVSVQVAGPITTVNMGTEWIYAGNTVVARWPEYNVRNGQKVAKVQVMGTPGSKFLFNMAPLRIHDIYGEFMDIAFRVADEYDAMDDNERKDATMETLLSRFRHMAEKYSLLLNTTLEKDCPMLKFLTVIISSIFQKTPDEEARSYLLQDSDAYKAHENAMNGVLGKRKGPNTRRADSVTSNKRQKAQTTAYNGGNSSASASTNSSTASYGGGSVTVGVPRNVHTEIFLIGALMGPLTEQYNLYKQLAIGKALTTAGPGQPLDILLGYFT